MEGDGVRMDGHDSKEVLLALGKAQVDAMFRRQGVHMADDSEFLPLLEEVLSAFQMAVTEKAVGGSRSRAIIVTGS